MYISTPDGSKNTQATLHNNEGETCFAVGAAIGIVGVAALFGTLLREAGEQRRPQFDRNQPVSMPASAHKLGVDQTGDNLRFLVPTADAAQADCGGAITVQQKWALDRHYATQQSATRFTGVNLAVITCTNASGFIQKVPQAAQGGQ